MMQNTAAYETIVQMLERDLGFAEYSSNNQNFTIGGTQKLISNNEIRELLDLFFKALDMDKAKNFEGLDDLKECILREFSGNITENERAECFRSFSQAEQVIKHFLYLTDPKKWTQIADDIKKTLDPCLLMLDAIPSNYSYQAIDLNWAPESVYFQLGKRSDYPYLDHILRIYQWRNRTAHSAPAVSRFELPQLEQSLWFTYLYVVKLHKKTLRLRIETRERQAFERIEYCRNLVDNYELRNSTFKYFDFQWKNRATNACTGIEATMTMDNNACLIFGEAGSGKSVALSRLCYLAAKRHIQDASQPIPVLIELKDMPANQRIISKIAKILGCTDNECDAVLTKGRVLLFLDGINEVISRDPSRATVQLQREFIREIASLFNRYPKTRFWLSDRAMTNFGGDLHREIVKLELQQVTDQDIISFCRNYTADATLLDNITLSEGVVSFLNTPFKIQLFCDLLVHTQTVPSSEIQLIDQYLHMIIEREYTEKATLNLTSTWIFHEILETIGVEISRAGGSISIANARTCTHQVLARWSNNLSEVDNCLKIAQELKILQIDNNDLRFTSDKYSAYFLANFVKKRREGATNNV